MRIKFATYFFAFLALAFLTNFLWESLHAIFLYQNLSLLGVERYVQLMLRASLIDMLWLGGVFLGLAVYYRDLFWFRTLSHGKMQGILFIPIVIALLIEMQGVFIFQKWAYSSLMPTLWGIGISPLLQLPATMLFCVIFIHRIRLKG